MHSCLSLALVVIKQTFFLHLYFSISLEAILQEHLHVHMAGRHQQPFLSKESYHCAERSLRLGRRGRNCEVFPINRENILHLVKSLNASNNRLWRHQTKIKITTVTTIIRHTSTAIPSLAIYRVCRFIPH